MGFSWRVRVQHGELFSECMEYEVKIITKAFLTSKTEREKKEASQREEKAIIPSDASAV